MPSNDDLLFAEHVVKKGFLSDEDVQESLKVQARMEEMGVRDSLRNVLVKRGVLREGDAALVARAAGVRSGREPIPGYTLQARLGSGAMGSVYRAYQRGMKRDVAVKILRRDLTDDPRQVERLQREAALVGKLDHPNIVRGLDSGETDGLVWFVMELVEGETLHQRIRREGCLPAAEAVAVTRQMAAALAHAHSLGVVHRDIKPGNILLTKEGLPRLTDYGLAKGESDDALTQLDATLGTPQYIAPEQARNPRDADIRSDIYSLGATLYAMLTGHPPFQGETLAQTLTKVLYEHPQPLSEAAPDTPREVVYVVHRMMAKDRRHRYATPQEVLRDLRALEHGRLHVPNAFKGDIEEFVERRRRRRVWITGGLLVAACVAIALGTLAYRTHNERERVELRARSALDDLLVRPGDPETWEGRTIQEMIRVLEAHRTRYPTTEAAAEALEHLERWRRQAAALVRINELRLRVDAMEEPVWTDVLAELRAEQRVLEEAGDETSVARGALASYTADVELRRDRRAREWAETAQEEAQRLPLEEAAARYEALARRLRERFYGKGPAPLAEAADRTALDFRRAQELLDASFAPYEQVAFSEGRLRDGDFQQLESALWDAVLKAESQPELIRILTALPPEGTRREQIVARGEAETEKLRAASRRAWRELSDEVDRLVAGRDYEAAEQTLREFSGRALATEKEAAIARLETLEKRRVSEAQEVLEATRDAATEYFGALGRRDYAAARDSLELLAVLLGGRHGAGGASAAFVQGGRRLVELIERLAWDALRARLTGAAPLERGLAVGTGIRYRDVGDVQLRGDELAFSHGSGHTWSGQIKDVALDDVLHYAGLPGASPAGALVHAAMQLVEYRPDSRPRRAVDRLSGLATFLERASGDPSLRPIAERLSALRLELVKAAEEEIAEAEGWAQRVHEEARRALDEGRHEDAYSSLDSLLTLQRPLRTDYVRNRRDEIERDRERAARGRNTSRYAEQFRGARLVERDDGLAELIVDFESPGVEEALGLDTEHARVAARRLVRADRPALPADSGTTHLVDDRRLVWAPWDGEPEAHPRRFPLELRNPFQMRRRIEVSFLYQSDAPFFLAVSVGGSTAGVLSAAGVRGGGRGVRVWRAEDLDRPDEAFGERHRWSYLERHPELLRKEGDTTFFQFQPGREYRVRFVKDERRAALYVDGRRLAEEDVRSAASPSLDGKIVLLTYTSGEVDELHVIGTLDPEWLRERR